MQSNPQVPWTEEQWAQVNQAIQEEAQRARVAAKFLPLYGPLSADTDFVRSGEISYARPLKIADKEAIELSTLQIKVALRGAQLADPELGSVLSLFRRAANILARSEDAVIFNGRHSPPDLPPGSPDVGEQYVGEDADGLLDHAHAYGPQVTDGDTLVTAVANAIAHLEQAGHFGPFAVALSQQLFLFAQTPSRTTPQVIPQDRIIPFLQGGQLLRSSVLPNEKGVVVALGGEPIEFVVATDMSLQFLQVTQEPEYVFRVYEKVALRIKGKKAIALLGPARPAAPTGQGRPSDKKETKTNRNEP
jgi:uncharacterized linocin/CFP29 family protein